jgi:hypothetical protein
MRTTNQVSERDASPVDPYHFESDREMDQGRQNRGRRQNRGQVKSGPLTRLGAKYRLVTKREDEDVTVSESLIPF